MSDKRASKTSTDTTPDAVKTRVFILYTGGTIGMAPKVKGDPASPLVPKPLEELRTFAPILLEKNDWNIEFGFGSFEPPLDSSEVGPEHWLEMARRIADVYDDYDGFVILHGTDTMAFTASALAFIFENLGKPVVITGSQLPISNTRTDAVMNLVNAIQVAAYKATALPLIPEVVIVFADKILRGCRTRKVSSTSWAGFDSPNFPALGNIGEHIVIREELLRPPPVEGQTFQVNIEIAMAGEVMAMSLFPGLRPAQIEGVLNVEGVKAILLSTFGSGNAPGTADFLDTIAHAVAANKTIVNLTQCLEGMVEMGLYAASSGLLERGVISGLDMTPEAALAKLMWTLGTKMGNQVVSQMQVNQRGEQSQNLFDIRYRGCGSPSEPETTFSEYMTPDRRFAVSRLSRAVIRLSGLGVSGMDVGRPIEIRVFMNMPTAQATTPSDHPRCVARLDFEWDGSPSTRVALIERDKVRSVIGDGDIVLSVVSDPGVGFWFKGLYLALFTRA